MSNINIICLLLNNIVPHVLWPMWDPVLNLVLISPKLTFCTTRHIWRLVTQKQYALHTFRDLDRITNTPFNKEQHAPTINLYDNSYGSISEFRVFGDLDLDLWPILVIKYNTWVSLYNKSMVWYRAMDTQGHTGTRSQIDRQTDQQTDRQTDRHRQFQVCCIPILKTPTNIFLEILQIL